MSNFIDNYLNYIRLFENNAMSIHDILDMPYFLFSDLINKQLILKKKEKEMLDAMKEKQKHQKSGKKIVKKV